MANLILFINSFLSYLLVVAVFVIVIGIAVFAGMKLRKNKNAKEAAESAATTENGEIEEQ